MINIKNKGKGIQWTDEKIEKYISQFDCKLVTIERKCHIILNLLCRCGKSFKPKLHEFINKEKRQCRRCAQTNIKKVRRDLDDVKNYIENEGYILLSKEYKNTTQVLDVRCLKGHIYKTTFNNFKNGKRCAICSGNIKNTQIYKDQISKLTNYEFEVVGEYRGTNIKIMHKHVNCGKEFEISPHKFLFKQRCPKCAKRHKWNNELIKEKIYEMYNGEYELIDEFKTVNTLHLMKHNACNNQYKVTITNFLSGKKCPFCAGNMKRTTEQYREEVNKTTDGEYLVLDDYKNVHTQILHKHIKCGHKFLVTPNSFLNNESRCPMCSKSSKGERKISQWLKNNNINFITEYKFCELKSDRGHPLRFDFAIFDKYNNLYCLLEFDGQQHFRWVKYLMSLEDFKMLKYRDSLKDDYCKKNNIHLLRINYKDFKNINQILEKELHLLLHVYVKEVI